MICKRIFISGRVQGVFYRDSTRQVANELGLSGGVRNLYDGRVEVQVSGDAVDIEKLEKWLENGPKMANVTTIESNDVNISDCDMLARSGTVGNFAVFPDA